MTGGNQHDVTQLLPMIEAILPVRAGGPGSGPCRCWPTGPATTTSTVHWCGPGIEPVIARRAAAHGSGRGRYRGVAGRAIALLQKFRQLRIRWEIGDDIHEAFLSLGCATICWRRLKFHSLCWGRLSVAGLVRAGDRYGKGSSCRIRR